MIYGPDFFAAIKHLNYFQVRLIDGCVCRGVWGGFSDVLCGVPGRRNWAHGNLAFESAEFSSLRSAAPRRTTDPWTYRANNGEVPRT